MRNFRDLQVWKKAHLLTLATYRSTQGFPSEARYGLTSQMRRSCASIAANLAEGCGRRSDGAIAMGPGAEMHLQLAGDLGLLKNADYVRLDADLNEIMRMRSAFSQRLKRVVAA
jgi:four helix bundle protein